MTGMNTVLKSILKGDDPSLEMSKDTITKTEPSPISIPVSSILSFASATLSLNTHHNDIRSVPASSAFRVVGVNGPAFESRNRPLHAG